MMNPRFILASAGLAGAAIVLGQMASSNVNADPLSRSAPTLGDEAPGEFEPIGDIGPDVIVGSLNGQGPLRWGTADGMTAYSIGTTSCNVGDEQLDWYDNSPNHPVIGQNMYRLKDGRFQQIGQSWLKHGFCALQQSLCGACIPAGPCCCTELGVGCSDPYSASLNGSQGGLGPKYEVNPTTGVFPWPYDSPAFSGVLARRCQVKNTDLDPDLNPDALYFGEGQYISPDDAAAGNGSNNVSYRKANIINNDTFNMAWDGPTVQERAAIYAWPEYQDGVNLTEKQSLDGVFIHGAVAIDQGDGTWRYEYALFNMNSDRAAGSFAVERFEGVEITDAGFSDVEYHSGEPWDGTDWTITITDDQVIWETEAFGDNTSANALRWGTMYNFWFVANTPPDARSATVGFFKPGASDSFTISSITPSAVETCPADFDNDDVVGPADLAVLLAAWNKNTLGDLDGDGDTDAADLAILLAAWGSC